jgi:ribose/xylose/arabinose/galactoside ABC-type transport system permease subunit
MATTQAAPAATPPAPTRERRRLSELPWPELASTLGLVALAIIFAIANPGYLSEGNVSAILQASAILIVLTIGQTFVIATGGIDLSVASTMTLGAIVLGEFYALGWNIWLAALAGFVAAALVGVINGLVISKGGITDFIVTLGTLSAASGLALILADGKKTTVIEPALIKLSVDGIWIFSWAVIIALALAVIAHVVLFHTRFGVHVLGTGGSSESSRALGIRVWAVKTAVYVISAGLAGVAALLLVARVGAAEPAANTSFLLNSVAAVVLGGVSLFGGRATIAAPVMGALLLTALVNGLTRVGLSEFYQPLTVGVVVVLAAFLTRFNRS